MELITSGSKSIFARHKKAILIFAGLLFINVVLIYLYESYESRRLVVHFTSAFDSLFEDHSSSVKDKNQNNKGINETIVTNSVPVEPASKGEKNLTDWDLEIALTSALIKEQSVIKNLKTVRRQNRIKLFKENHKRIIETLEPVKFVYIGRNGAGYGNKMYSLFTGFMVGLVTDSAIIVNWTDINRHIEEPFYKCFQTSNTTEGLLNYLYKRNETFYFPYMTANTYSVKKKLNELYRAIPSSPTRYVFTGIGGTFFEMALNKTYWPTFQAYDLVSDETLKRADIILSQTPLENTNYTVNTLWRVGFEFAHNILKTFWYPNANLQQHVDYYYNNYFKGNFIIGMQLRDYLNWQDDLVVFECAKDIEKYIKKPVKWYVSTDNNDRLKKIKEMFGDKVIHSNGSITHVDANPDGYLRALLDIELLAKSDELIISGGSTFGFMAAIRMGEYPLFVDGHHNATKCERFSFSNPSLTPYNAAVVR